MILKKQIPEDFYKLFRTRNMDAYMMFLAAIYEENSELYTALGLTLEEGQAIIAETMSRGQIDWQEDEESQEEETQDTDMETDASIFFKSYFTFKIFNLFYKHSRRSCMNSQFILYCVIE